MEMPADAGILRLMPRAGRLSYFQAEKVFF